MQSAAGVSGVAGAQIFSDLQPPGYAGSLSLTSVTTARALHRGAILNALAANEDMTGRIGHRTPAGLPGPRGRAAVRLPCW
jgi:hypothetical protein